LIECSAPGLVRPRTVPLRFIAITTTRACPPDPGRSGRGRGYVEAANALVHRVDAREKKIGERACVVLMVTPRLSKIGVTPFTIGTSLRI